MLTVAEGLLTEDRRALTPHGKVNSSRVAVRPSVWLVEDPYVATADLMVGCGGVAHFLLRLDGADLGYPLLPSSST